MPLTRRNFLKHIAIASGATYLGMPSSRLLASKSVITGAENLRGFLMIGNWPGAFKYKNESKDKSVTSEPGQIAVFDLQTKMPQFIDVPFHPHGFAQNPKNPGIFACFEKWGSHAAIFQSNQRKPPVIIEGKDCRFFGHGSFSADGSNLFLSMMNDIEGKGGIAIFDSVSGKMRGKYAVPGKFPHELKLNTHGQILVLSSSLQGEVTIGSILSWIDPSNGKIIKTKEFPLKPNQQSNHFYLMKDDWIVIGGISGGPNANSLPGLVGSLSPKGKFEQMKGTEQELENLVGESLSITADEGNNLALITSPSSGFMYVWNYKENKIESVFETGKTCQGIALDKRNNRFYLANSSSQSLLSFKPKTFTSNQIVGPLPNKGSHLYFFEA